MCDLEENWSNYWSQSLKRKAAEPRWVNTQVALLLRSIGVTRWAWAWHPKHKDLDHKPGAQLHKLVKHESNMNEQQMILEKVKMMSDNVKGSWGQQTVPLNRKPEF